MGANRARGNALRVRVYAGDDPVTGKQVTAARPSRAPIERPSVVLRRLIRIDRPAELSQAGPVGQVPEHDVRIGDDGEGAVVRGQRVVGGGRREGQADNARMYRIGHVPQRETRVGHRGQRAAAGQNWGSLRPHGWRWGGCGR